MMNQGSNAADQETYYMFLKMRKQLKDQKKRKEEEERRKRREDDKRKERLLEAAFEGNNEVILEVLAEVDNEDKESGLGEDDFGKIKRKQHQLNMVQCEDVHGDSPLSEAAGAGHSHTIELLVERGASPNTRGSYKRTALYRASFNGHADTVLTLLEMGADPRIIADDGMTPIQIATDDEVIRIMDEWDIEQTELLLEKYAFVQREWEKQMNKIFEEEAKRTAEEQQDEKELLMDDVKIEKSGYSDKEMQKFLMGQGGQGMKKKIGLTFKQVATDATLPGVKVLLSDLDDFLSRDEDSKIAKSGKWPLIIDPTQQAATHLRYKNSNYINAMSPVCMKPERIRMSLIGSLRFGKPMVLDMMGMDVYEQCAIAFDEVKDGLLKSIMDKSIIKPEKFLDLIHVEDGEDYIAKKFTKMRLSNFQFFIVTQTSYPSDDLMDKTYPIRVYLPPASRLNPGI